MKTSKVKIRSIKVVVDLASEDNSLLRNICKEISEVRLIEIESGLYQGKFDIDVEVDYEYLCVNVDGMVTITGRVIDGYGDHSDEFKEYSTQVECTVSATIYDQDVELMINGEKLEKVIEKLYK